MKVKKIFTSLVFATLIFSLSACQGLTISQASASLTASGTISADSTRVAPEIGGKIAEIKVSKGDTVKKGDVLFQIDEQILQAQRKQATAALDSAKASQEAAQKKLDNAQAQYDLTVQTARMQNKTGRIDAWKTTQSDEIKQPVWYFQKSEQITALQSEIDTANQALATEQSNLADELKKASNQDFVAAEQRLAKDQAAYQDANLTLDQAHTAQDNSDLVDAAQKDLDAAKSDLDAAQQDYNKMLTTTAASDVLEARARVAAAQARLDNAKDSLDQLMNGDQSIQIQVAQTGIDAAKAGVNQTDTAVNQAQSQLDLIDVQLGKLTVASPVDGVVLSRPQNPGEISAAGATVVEIGSLDVVKLTVYVPEDQYGSIKLDQDVKVKVDTFAGKNFSGRVTNISNQAEFTPRNVQTIESRSTTVYAIEISIPNPDHDLKDGMPADATF